MNIFIKNVIIKHKFYKIHFKIYVHNYCNIINLECSKLILKELYQFDVSKCETENGASLITQ